MNLQSPKKSFQVSSVLIRIVVLKSLEKAFQAKNSAFFSMKNVNPSEKLSHRIMKLYFNTAGLDLG